MMGTASNYEFRNVLGHIEVFLDGTFQFSSDTYGEAEQELEDEYDEEGTYLCSS